MHLFSIPRVSPYSGPVSGEAVWSEPVGSPSHLGLHEGPLFTPQCYLPVKLIHGPLAGKSDWARLVWSEWGWGFTHGHPS